MKTQAVLAHSSAVATQVLAAVPAKDGSVERLLQDSTVDAQTGGDILAFSVRDGDEVLAQRLASQYARQYTLYRRHLDRLPVKQALAALRSSPSGSAGGDSAEQARELQTLEAVTGSGAVVVDPATSATKTRPETVKNVIAGLLLGTLSGWVSPSCGTRSTHEWARRRRSRPLWASRSWRASAPTLARAPARW